MLIHPENLIVCHKDKQPPVQRALGILLPVLFWGFLLYILCTFIALCSGITGYSLFENLIGHEDIDAIKAVSSRYFPLIGGFIGSFLLWALYHYMRFHGQRDRRRTRPAPARLDETVKFSRLDNHEVRTMRQAKIMTCLFDGDGNIVGIKHDARPPSAGEKRD